MLEEEKPSGAIARKKERDREGRRQGPGGVGGGVERRRRRERKRSEEGEKGSHLVTSSDTSLAYCME